MKPSSVHINHLLSTAVAILSINGKLLTIAIVSKVKVKVTLEQATKAQRGSKVIAILFP